MRNRNRKAVVTTGLIVINTLIFFALSMEEMFGGDRLMNWGVMYEPYILAGSYYRLLSSIFLHFSWDHLVNNMIMLGAAGSLLERETGSVRFFIIYIFSGIFGNAVSFAVGLFTGSYAYSAGASGAVFGILGAVLIYILMNRRQGRISRKGIIFLIVFSLYMGFRSPGVDNAAHVGGLIGGAVGFLVTNLKK